MLSFIGTIIVIGIIAVFIITIVVSQFLLICHPNEVIVLSGRSRRLKDGSIVGYRIIRGGRALRIPMVEKAARMSLETIPLELKVDNAYSKGGIPLKVEAIANVKVDSSEPTFGNAVERFLDKPQSEVHRIAKDTLEGNLRGVLATLTPEEVNEDRLKFAESLISEADNDLRQLGLQLDTLKIQNVSDAASHSRAEVAKAEAAQEIQTAQINTDREVKVREALAGQKIEQENNNLRVIKAELDKVAVVKEEEASVAREKARAEYEQAMEHERIILQQKRLTADVIEPARAQKEAMELEAKGQAAPILETGKANLEVLNEMIATYKSADGEGEKVFMLNMLPEIISQIVNTVGEVKVDKLSVIDAGGGFNGNGSGLGKAVNQMPVAVLSFIEQIENATGVNILSQFTGSPKEVQKDESKPKYSITHKAPSRPVKKVVTNPPESDFEDHVHSEPDDTQTKQHDTKTDR
ncbi:MAG TPA: SPFH domain-containing protein [Thermodesulfobacteriota bacterium]|nr:SPFH domain-containing protein [Thermodesulfobacteriota bacterium]